MIKEEGDYYYGHGEMMYSRKGYLFLLKRCQLLIVVFGFVVIFTVFCLILWVAPASRPYKPRAFVKVKILMISSILTSYVSFNILIIKNNHYTKVSSLEVMCLKNRGMI